MTTDLLFDSGPASAPATCGVCGAGPDLHAPTCALVEAPRLRALVEQIRDGLRAVDARTANTFDGHAVRELLRIAEEGVDRG